MNGGGKSFFDTRHAPPDNCPGVCRMPSASCDIIKEMYFVENKQRKRNILYYSVNYANISLVCIYFHKTKLRMEAYL